MSGTLLTELGIENIGLYNNSEHIDGVEFYKATTEVLQNCYRQN